jgi:hypothetical protein
MTYLIFSWSKPKCDTSMAVTKSLSSIIYFDFFKIFIYVQMLILGYWV